MDDKKALALLRKAFREGIVTLPGIREPPRCKQGGDDCKRVATRLQSDSEYPICTACVKGNFPFLYDPNDPREAEDAKAEREHKLSVGCTISKDGKSFSNWPNESLYEDSEVQRILEVLAGHLPKKPRKT